jgi:hypothetical protein
MYMDDHRHRRARDFESKDDSTRGRRFHASGDRPQSSAARTTPKNRTAQFCGAATPTRPIEPARGQAGSSWWAENGGNEMVDDTAQGTVQQPLDEAIAATRRVVTEEGYSEVRTSGPPLSCSRNAAACSPWTET